jgi:hypothetical protein
MSFCLAFLNETCEIRTPLGQTECNVHILEMSSLSQCKAVLRKKNVLGPLQVALFRRLS